MFKLQPNPTFWTKASIPVPGSEKDAVIEIEFRHKTKTALDVFLKSSAETISDVDSLQEIVQGWKGIDVEFNADNLSILLDNYPAAARALFSAYISALVDNRKKN